MFRDRNGQPFFGRNALAFALLFALAVAGKYALDKYWGRAYADDPLCIRGFTFPACRPLDRTADPLELFTRPSERL